VVLQVFDSFERSVRLAVIEEAVDDAIGDDDDDTNNNNTNNNINDNINNNNNINDNNNSNFNINSKNNNNNTNITPHAMQEACVTSLLLSSRTVD